MRRWDEDPKQVFRGWQWFLLAIVVLLVLGTL